MAESDEAKKALKLLKEAGMQKLNFAGGEPFLYPDFLGHLLKYCKEELGLNTSIVSNGSKLRHKWFEKYGRYVDILAISCDSFNEETNIKIGRGNGRHVQNVKKARDLCRDFGILFKINTVVSAFNYEEDMTEQIKELAPFRWKVFQVLILEGENSGSASSLRDARKFIISKEQFQSFLDRHDSLGCLVPEPNDKMQNSYLVLDEELRFLDCSSNGKIPSDSILDVGVAKALQQSGFDEGMFHARGGIYHWTRDLNENQKCSTIPDW